MFGKKPKQSGAHFPYAPMANEQALDIVQHCARIDPTLWRDLFYSESHLPAGGFPAVAEAFARLVVSNPFKEDPVALQARAELGVTLMAATIPDQLFALVEAYAEHGLTQDDGALQAMFLAKSVAHAITERQTTEGRSMLRHRIERLGGRWLDSSGVSFKDGNPLLPVRQRRDAGE